jgi:hypothetical protein
MQKTALGRMAMLFRKFMVPAFNRRFERLRFNEEGEVFTALTEKGIHVLSMRNKTNRLEELFFDLVEKNLQESNHE